MLVFRAALYFIKDLKISPKNRKAVVFLLSKIPILPSTVVYQDNPSE